MEIVSTHVDWRAAPKISLHCHLEGTVTPSTLFDLAAKNGVSLRDDATLENCYNCTTFAEFLAAIIGAFRALAEPTDYGRIAAEFVTYALRENIRYAEIFVSPSAWSRVHPRLDIESALRAIATEFIRARAAGCEIAILFDLTRSFGPEIAETTVDLALASSGLGVIGIGIGGDERNHPAPAFAPAFARARAGGLRLTAHAGEDAGAQSVVDAITLLHAERIGHGIAAVHDPAVLALLADRGIVVEQSPASNARTGVWGDGPHPIKKFVEAGVRVAVDADDPAIFATTISAELEQLARLYGADFAFARLDDAIAGAFIDDARRAAFRVELNAFRRTVARGETPSGRE